MEVDVDGRERVRRLFLDRGLTRVGFTTAEPVEDRVTDWVASGRHAGMTWLERSPDERADPARRLDGARSVICAAAAYPATDARGAIAGYARGEDYHRTLTDALLDVARRMEALFPGIATRVCVDTAPLLERALAARAGLGWVGRNTMLLDETHGPWVLLGEVLTDAVFPPDPPGVDRCGTCTACVEACPTQAIDDSRGLDARRCLSYWTIEHRGEVPGEWADAAAHRVFGCDDCLTACPFPAQSPEPPAVAADDAPFQPREDLVDPDLDDLEQRARESFRRHFGSTPIERARKAGFLRNIGIARNNARDDARAAFDRAADGDSG
ncbi:MAG: tRNA epoxyqueuosine(34) reductase QueG [Planctomycetota bacterium]|jgi:epoxyqueuosine reductase